MPITQQILLNKIKARKILKNCCLQKWATKKEIDYWLNSIKKYDIEIFNLCEIIGENEYKLIEDLC